MPPEKLSKLCTDYFYVYFKNVYTKLEPSSKLDEAMIKVANPTAQVEYESGLKKYLKKISSYLKAISPYTLL